MGHSKLYSRAEIETLHLPGYREAGSLHAALADETSAWDAVLSASIFVEQDGIKKVLTGIRREETHRTHPGVVSTPTMRLPNTTALDIIRSRLTVMGGRYPTFNVPRLNPDQGLSTTVVKTIPESTAAGNQESFPNSRSSLPYVIGSLLSQKLSSAPALETRSDDKPLGQVSLSAIMAGFSHATTERGTDLFEPLIMLGATVELEDAAIIPSETESYRNVGFVPVSDFLEGHSQRKAGTLIPSLREGDEIDVCVKGMCLATTRTVIGAELPNLLATA